MWRKLKSSSTFSCCLFSRGTWFVWKYSARTGGKHWRVCVDQLCGVFCIMSMRISRNQPPPPVTLSAPNNQKVHSISSMYVCFTEGSISPLRPQGGPIADSPDSISSTSCLCYLFIYLFIEHTTNWVTFHFNYQSMKKPHKWELHLHTANEDKLRFKKNWWQKLL